MIRNEVTHQMHAGRVVHNHQLDAALSKIILGPLERPVLTDDNPRNLVEQRSPTAHIARRQGRIQRRPLIISCMQPTGVLKAIHLRVENRTAILNSAVVPATCDLAVDHQDRSDRDAAFFQPDSGFFDRRFKKPVHVDVSPFQCTRPIEAPRITTTPVLGLCSDHLLRVESRQTEYASRATTRPIVATMNRVSSSRTGSSHPPLPPIGRDASPDAAIRVPPGCHARAWIVCFLLIWLALLWAGREKMLRDPGTFWHTVVGQKIIQSGKLIHIDPFSFSQEGQTWIAQQWLGECVMAVVHACAGLDGLLLLSATLLAALFAGLARRLVRSGLPWPAVAILLLLAIAASSHHFLVRPHLATIALMALCYGILCDVDSGKRPPRSLLLLPPLFVLWTNIHGGALGGIATTLIVLFAWLAAPSLPKRLGLERSRRIKPIIIGAVASLSITAVLVNPYGPALPRVWLGLMHSEVLPKLIIEHAPLDFFSVEGVMMMALAVVYLTILIRTWRNLRRTERNSEATSLRSSTSSKDMGRLPFGLRLTWLIPLVWLLLAVSRVRHGPLFAVVAVIAIAEMLPFAARRLTSAANSRQGNSRSMAGRFAFTLPIGAVALALALQTSGIPCPLIGANWARLDPAYWPVHTVETLREHLASSELSPTPRGHTHGLPIRAGTPPRIFNDMRFGGYLIYHLPEARIYIDDRCELYRDFGLLRYAQIIREPALIEGLAAYQDVDIALVHKGTKLDRYLASSPRWLSLSTDPTASLYRRASLSNGVDLAFNRPSPRGDPAIAVDRHAEDHR